MTGSIGISISGLNLDIWQYLIVHPKSTSDGGYR